MDKGRQNEQSSEYAAGNGILNRRGFLERALFAGATGAAGAGTGVTTAWAEPLAVPRWMTEPGAALSAYGQPSRFERRPASQRPIPQRMGSAASARRFTSSMA